MCAISPTVTHVPFTDSTSAAAQSGKAHLPPDDARAG